jgi:LacI family transcriptional regulator
MDSKKPSTLRDVARVAGVSITTVSHVINGTRFVGEEYRNRVLQAIQATDYRPNWAARAVRRARTESIGFVASDITNPFSTAVVKGIESRARQEGHMLLLANSDGDPKQEVDAIMALSGRRVDGLIIALAAGPQPETLSLLNSLNVPVVLLDRMVRANLDQVLVENTKPVSMVVAHLIALGHRRIGMIAGTPKNGTTEERIAGWQQAHDEAGLLADPVLLAYGNSEAGPARQAVMELMSSPAPPTAIFVGSNEMTIGVVAGLRAMGLAIPGDVALACFDDFEWADAFEPRLTAIAQPTFAIGTEAVRLIMSRLDKTNRRRRIVRLAPTIVHRDSCGDGNDAWNPEL